MPTGKVKWFDSKKGYGFIIGEEGQDVFVHYTCIVGEGFRALKDGELVAYDLVKSDKGHQAQNVSRQKADTPAASALASPGAPGQPPAGSPASA